MTQHTEAIIMEGVTEYAEGMDVSLSTRNGRLTVDAKNEGGHNGTDVDLVQLLLWVRKNLPEMLYQPWVGLTKVQKDDFADAYGSYAAVCAIEQALKERNT